MRFILVCGGMEPGRDGVGDYTRVLGRELRLAGHEVRLIAIHDRNIHSVTETVEFTSVGEICICRLPSCLSWSGRGEFIRGSLTEFEADWATLQFVPFSFHSKGLKRGLGRWLRDCIPARHWHIMFHETWVGFTHVATLKHRVWGAGQRFLAQRMVTCLAPAVIHTSNPLYQIMLARHGIHTLQLQIPSNIPVSNIAVPQIQGEFEALGIRKNERVQWMVIGTFGTIHPGYDYVSYFRTLVATAKGRRQKIRFLIMGRAGAEAEKLCSQLRDAFGSELLVHAFGQRTEAEVSAFFQLLDYGLATVSRPFLGKSSVVAAMKLHGLEILVPRKLVLPDYDAELASYPDAIISAPTAQFEPMATARQFLADIADIS